MSQPERVDPRALRFNAAATSVVLALALVASTPLAIALVALQTVVFAISALVDLRLSPYSLLYSRLVAPRLAPPSELEDARPPRFAQLVGLTFAVVALGGLALGLPAVFLTATALALVAALLNAVVGLCLGCEMYLTARRLTPARG
ncbi:DUF4395 domain-containing protein [Aeromicrobium sp. CF4.19]|uniref:DUF4395 domain-containing protein n=1 Tax=Aeromicrobium sp. CF4.19 TaxID=3373082 RepID=UPI003EE4FCF3